jgi:pantothenate kinase type III
VSEQPFHAEIDKLRGGTRAQVRTIVEAAVPSVAPALGISVWQGGAPWFEAYAGWVDPETETTPVSYTHLTLPTTPYV